MARMPPHPGKPGNRVWTRNASGKMVPDLSKASPRVRSMTGAMPTAKTKRSSARRGK